MSAVASAVHDVVWAPQPGSQQHFLSCPVFEVLYEGTRGPGKTDALLMDFLQHVDCGYGADWRGILFRQTYKQLKDVIAKSKKWFYKIYGDAAKYNKVDHEWTFPNGETLLLRHFNHDDDYWNYHGHEYPWIAWEELCNWPSDTGYRRMMSCCRSSNPHVPRKYRATTNPYGPGHNWVKLRFRLPESRFKIIKRSKDADGRVEPDRVAIHGHIYENKILLAADPGYIDRVAAAARNDAELKAWIEGRWDIIAGGMFDDVWDPKIHVLKPFPIPDSWRKDRSFDWGSSAPFSVGWWAESDGTDFIDGNGVMRSSVRGDLFRVAEWYGWNGRPNEGLRLLASEITEGIVERELKRKVHGNYKAGPADTSIFDVENGVSIAVDMTAPVRIEGRQYSGVQWTRADKSSGSRKTGWELMRTMFKSAIPKNGMPRERPGLYVFSNCSEFRRTIPVLPRDDKDQDDVNTDAEDHVADEVRYRVRANGVRIRSGQTVGGY